MTRLLNLNLPFKRVKNWDIYNFENISMNSFNLKKNIKNCTVNLYVTNESNSM